MFRAHGSISMVHEVHWPTYGRQENQTSIRCSSKAPADSSTLLGEIAHCTVSEVLRTKMERGFEWQPVQCQYFVRASPLQSFDRPSWALSQSALKLHPLLHSSLH